MSRFPGHIIKLPANTPSQSSAPGVWTLKDQLVAQRNNQWPFQRDPDFRYTTLLLQGNVPNTTGPQAMNLPLAYNSDASSNNFLITPNGDVSPRPFSPYGGGNYSNGFDGAADFLGIANNALVQLTNATAFTIEAWVYPISIANNPQIVFAYNPSSPYQGYSLRILTSSGLFEMFDGTSWISFGAAQLNTWQHIAVSYEGNGTTRRFFINGVQQGPAITVPSTINWTSGGVNISSSGESFNGYISNLRIVKGTAVYTSNFTPPSQPLTAITNTSLLTCQSNRFIDNSGNNLTITRNGDVRVTDNSPFVSADFTTGSGYFDGNGDYLNAGASTSLSCGSGSFTVETWIYPSVLAQSSIYASTANGGQFFSFASGQGIGVGRVNVAWDYSTNVFPVYYAWNHIVWVRSGNNLSIYLNGTRIGNVQNSQNFTLNGGSATIGTEGSIASTIPACYMAGFRVVTGTAVYDPTQTSIPVPTAPPTAVSGTQLLTLLTRAPSQNHGFIDSSPNEFIVTRNGNVSQGTFSPFSPSGWGYYLAEQQNNTVNFTTSAGTDFQFSGDFTIEGWVYPQNSSGDGSLFVVSDNTNYLALNISISANVFNIYLNGGTPAAVITSDIPVAAWTHVAMVRNGSGTGNIKLYVNGGLKGSATNTSTLGFANPAVCRIGGGVSGINRYYSNVRVCKSAVYTAAFTPSTLPLSTTSQGATNCVLLTANANRFLNQTAGAAATITGSPSVQAFSPFAPANSVSPLVTGGSGYFPGSTSVWLVAPDNPALELSSNDFTIECWVYSTADFSANRIFTSKWNHFVFGINSTPALSFTWYGTTNGSATGTLISTAPNAWHHFAVCRQGGTLYMFQNGQKLTQSNSTITGTLNNDSYGPMLGGNENVVSGAIASANEPWYGYISGYRMVNGTALYTSSFPIPTAPPTAIPGTSLLLNFTGGGIVDATGKNVIETFGNAQLTTAQPKWTGQGSLSNNGAAGARFQVSSNSAPPLFNVGTGDYTVEFWVNTGTPASQQCILDFRNADVAGQGYALIFNTSRQIIMYYNVGNRITTSAISANVWTHIAVVRYNGVYTIYVNGSASGGTYNNSDAVAPPANRPLIGSVSDGSQVFNGNFSDFRISRIARYTGNFNINTIPGPFPIG